ncbi:MAG: aldose epimerase family protein [Clostridium sp.]
MEIIKRKIMEWDSKDIYEYTLDNGDNLKVSILNYGGIITKIETRDRYGKWGNIVLTYNDYINYIDNTSYYGAIIGRTAGRIAGGEVEIDNKIYKLKKNYGANQGHGGEEGFNKKFWDIKEIKNEDECKLELKYFSKDGEEGYPGNLNIKVIYTVTKDNELKFETYGISDKKTLMNITNHTYFNLSGNYKEDILMHKLKMNCDRFLEINNTGAVTGNIIPCNDGVFSFLNEKRIGEDIEKNNHQLILGSGYDHPFLFEENKVGDIIISEQKSGRVMEIKTNHKGVVIYTQNFIDGKELIGEKAPKDRMGICLEVQSPPIGINGEFKEHSLLESGKEYYKQTVYKFGIK